MILISWRKPFLWSSPLIRAKKGLNFWQRPFFWVFAINSTEKRPEFLVKTFLYWSAWMVAARWNLVRTECGPLLQKVADPWLRAFIDLRTVLFKYGMFRAYHPIKSAKVWSACKILRGYVMLVRHGKFLKYSLFKFGRTVLPSLVVKIAMMRFHNVKLLPTIAQKVHEDPWTLNTAEFLWYRILQHQFTDKLYCAVVTGLVLFK